MDLRQRHGRRQPSQEDRLHTRREGSAHSWGERSAHSWGELQTRMAGRGGGERPTGGMLRTGHFWDMWIAGTQDGGLGTHASGGHCR